MTTKNEKTGKGDIAPVAARGAVKGNGVIYVLVIGVILAAVAMFVVFKFSH